MSTQQRAVNDFPKAHNFIQGGDQNNTSSLVEIIRARVISFPAGQIFLRSKLRGCTLNPQRDASGIGSVFSFYLS